MPFRRTQKLVIAIPYYNHPDLLYRTMGHLAPLLNSGHHDLTVLISDDASPEVPDPKRLHLNGRIRYVRQPKNLGLVGNYNYCVEAIRAEGPAWSLILDADDSPTELAFQRVVHYSTEDSIALMVGGYRIVDIDHLEGPGKSKTPVNAPMQLNATAAFRWFYPHNRAASSAVWIHSDAYAQETYDPACLYCCDWDMYIRLASHGNVLLLPDIFCVVLHHSNNNTWSFMKSGEAQRNERETLIKNWPLAYRLHLSAFQRLLVKGMAEARYAQRAFLMRLSHR